MPKMLQNPNLRIVFGVTLIAVMGVASITPAFPTIMEEFGLAPPDVGILITAFTLPAVFLTPLAGILADRLGRKAILVPSLLLFAVAGSAITLVHDFRLIVGLRVVQGIGSAALGTLNVTLIGDLFEPRLRPEAMGYNASVLSLGVASYPAIGGFLAGIHWYAPFYLCLLAIPVALMVMFRLELQPPATLHGTGEYFKNAWHNINRPAVWSLFFINILMFIILYGALLSYFPILMRTRYNAPEWKIGLFLSIFSVATAIASSQIKRMSTVMGKRRQLTAALLLYITGLTGIGFVYQSAWLTLIPLVIFGFGHGMMFPVIQTLLVGMAPMGERAVFMSVNSMVLRIGQTAGPMLMGVMFLQKGLPSVYFGGAAVAAAMLIIWIFTPLQEPPE